MTTLKLTTHINVSPERCFDISRDVKVHELSTIDTNERAIAGRLSGLCELNDEITWEATHFGIKQKLTVKITKMEYPSFFEDTMLKGAFKNMRHEHHFKNDNGNTIMDDIFEYEAPLGILGKIFDKLILKNYMTRFLLVRNKVIKDVAEQHTNAQFTNA